MKKFSSILVVLLLMLASFTAGMEYPRGDVNQDGNVGISDVTCLINYLLSGTWGDEPEIPQTETFTVNGVSFTMVEVEGGTFMMGATEEQGEDARENEKPVHQVTLSSFSIGQTEVTQELWLAVMGSNPSYFSSANGYPEDLSRPVETVSWHECRSFIYKLNQMTGKTFRMPTEAEWEYAARGGNRSQGFKYAGSNNIDDVAWYYDNANGVGESSPEFGTHSVATKAPNELGLYDMSGNVWEFCQDLWGYYSSEPQTNPTGPDPTFATNEPCVVRSGSWCATAKGCRVSTRSDELADDVFYYQGLRLAL